MRVYTLELLPKGGGSMTWTGEAVNVFDAFQQARTYHRATAGMPGKIVRLQELDGTDVPVYNVSRGLERCGKCGRIKGCTADCEDMNCDHCYCYREGRDG